MTNNSDNDEYNEYTKIPCYGCSSCNNDRSIVRVVKYRYLLYVLKFCSNCNKFLTTSPHKLKRKTYSYVMDYQSNDTDIRKYFKDLHTLHRLIKRQFVLSESCKDRMDVVNTCNQIFTDNADCVPKPILATPHSVSIKSTDSDDIKSNNIEYKLLYIRNLLNK